MPCTIQYAIIVWENETTMQEKIKLAKKNKTKGFVLMELMLVIFIIALLLAMLFVFAFDRVAEAKMRAETAETRIAVVGLTTIMTLSYSDDNLDYYLYTRDKENVRLTKAGRKEIEELVSGDLGDITHIVIDKNYRVKSFDYTTPKGSTVNYRDGKIKVIDLY
jgi:prepilin-type N-terminal cleavage/methylation domain-containing protein